MTIKVLRDVMVTMVMPFKGGVGMGRGGGGTRKLLLEDQSDQSDLYTCSSATHHRRHRLQQVLMCKRMT